MSRRSARPARGDTPTPDPPAGGAGPAAARCRSELDARRSRCRIRLGGHMERWCLLKDRLGFALHSQLAKFLLDRYSSPGCVLCTGVEPPPSPPPPPPEGLQALVLLSHAHSRSCSLAPGLREPGGPGGGLVWECPAGHSFSWTPARPRIRRDAASLEESREETGTSSGEGARRVPDEGRQRDGEEEKEGFPPDEGPRQEEEDGEDGEEEREGFPPDEGRQQEEEDGEDGKGGFPEAVSRWAYSPSMEGEPAAAPRSPSPEAPGPPKEEGARVAPGAAPRPSQDPGARGAGRRPRASPQPPDDDVAQIGPKRIRKAAKRELLPCDFPGCGKIFSNRQYLNHHRKYQHDQQKSFSCPEPACRKAFNFKKHLKEHVKLHSDTRDYICEFCARPFRTSSNLAIHRRIHTGEKPLQCEICGFTCRQKASLNWHRRRHEEAAAAFRFPCELCGKRFEKPDNVAAHRSKSHPDPRPGPGTPPLPEGGAPQ
ncbi:LOW QUALITY PROTEIN: zinc finger protein 692 [Tachyglossus aculeatus]|uniref:LOW QUALITY PROTEIN: zinc finger protein 692 n=1 Tax=Tachyglossus aculeatus TaxID=9261 RepID=UPI0018F750A7|nr:LOW QUALITY PROTEIN: zinc finger protein 692 [Tachyglossus aculeatus]